MDSLPRALPAAGNEGMERETSDLETLLECGFPVGRLIVVPPAAEAEFYRLNNLSARLEGIFRGIDLSDPDDEDIEDLAPEAHALVRGHYLLDEFIDAFYEQTAALPELVRVRRPGDEGFVCRRGRSSLLMLKSLWSSSWEFDALWARLSRGEGLIPAPRAVFVHAAPFGLLPAEVRRDAEALLGRSLVLHGSEAGIVGVTEG